MDDLQYAGPLMDRTLRELEVINRFLGGNAVTLTALDKMTSNYSRDSKLCVADLGCGRGDMLRLIHQWAEKRNQRVELVGVDANEYVVKTARHNLKDLPNIKLLAQNILSDEFKQHRFDLVIGTLFYHHFTNHELIAFFKTMKRNTRVGFIINDIHRHPAAYYSIRMLTACFSKSSMVKFDAPLSVLRAFSRSELKTILEQSGLRNFEIRWRWAFRWQVLVYADSDSSKKH